ncbi:hypothetical protein QFC21_005374 [Naganishia friedmannii]|uniref:Uncharacterized protein n=1 Tax=Naganishia friedmannii TaxID=89922 RepID=A0ACC2V9H1_9TREE|nr:hypothetical protein QFC21_005374 [Naganishia friedmannii]
MSASPLSTWSHTDVATFLASYKCAHHAQSFKENDITGRVILELGQDELRELGVVKVGERVRLLSGIRELRRRSAVSLSGGMTPSTAGSASPGTPNSLRQGALSLRKPPPVARAPLSRSNTHNGRMGPPPVELQLNGHHPDSALLASSTLEESHNGTHHSHQSTLARTSSGSIKRLNASRPPPLHLHQTSHTLSPSFSGGGRSGEQRSQYHQLTNKPPASASSTLHTPTPRGGQTPIVSPNPRGNVPGPQLQQTQTPGQASRLLRPSYAPPATSPPLAAHARRSPSPNNGSHSSLHPQAKAFMDRPLPARPADASHAPTQSRPSGRHKLEPSPHLTTSTNAAGSPLLSPSPGGIVGTGNRKTAQPQQQQHQHQQQQQQQHPYAFARTGGSPTAATSTHSLRDSPRKDRASAGDHSGSLSGPSSSSSIVINKRPGRLHDRSNSASGVSGHNNSGQILSLADVRRRCVKFILADDGSTRVVDLESCGDGVEVMYKVLKKFGKVRDEGTNGDDVTSEGEDDGKGNEARKLVVDGWAVFVTSPTGHESAEKALTERELLAICQSSLDDPVRARGLTVRRLKKLGNRKDIEGFFGEVVPPTTVISPTSPLYMASSRITMPREWEEPQHQQQQQAATGQGKRLNRASISSVMSALGVNVGSASSQSAFAPTPESQYATPAPTTVVAAPKSPSSGSFLASRGKKMYNFFGHRPPSELISTHLADYFPSAKRKDLERGYRNSMLRFGNAGVDVGGNNSSATSVGGLGDSNRASYASSRTSSLENQLPSRFSIASSSNSSGNDNRASRISPGEGDVSITSHYDGSPRGPDRSTVPRVAVSTGSDGDRSASDGPGRPTSESYGASEDTENRSTTAAATHHRSRRNSALSTKSRMSMFRTGRRKSETPSMLTVDEITAEFEQRRASVITFAESEQEAEDAANRFSVPAAPGLGIGLGNRVSKAFRGSVLMPQAESEEEWAEDSLEEETSEGSEEDDEEEEEESGEEEEEEEIEDEQGKAFTSTGSKRSIKWIKGALIGAGSFGQVYLGMDAHNGLLMAVKQVDLSIGVQNEEKKLSMMTALQREIELLRELQHENIVQYLDSSADEKHLNIFLEYVPGGSVTALLTNYGAFEEALVKNFVRQILTGLEYLHGKGIVHRDIKGANILVDNKGGVKISDFGISKKVENNLLSTMRMNRPSLQGSVFWMAPEVVKQTAYTKKADIWSVGCLVIEMLTGSHPWPDLTQMQAIFRIGQMSKPTIPTDISAEAVEMLERTFEIDHHARPDAGGLLACAWLERT